MDLKARIRSQLVRPGPERYSESGARADNAWSAGGTLNLGALTLGTIYPVHRPQLQFDRSLQFMANDRRGWDSNFLLGLGAPLPCTGPIHGQHAQHRRGPGPAHDQGPGASLELEPGRLPQEVIGLSVGYRLTGQTTYQGALETEGQDMATNEVSAGINLTLSPSASLNLALTSSALAEPDGQPGRRHDRPDPQYRRLVPGRRMAGVHAHPSELTRSETDLSGEVNRDP